ncbi:uncharacterized protein LOC110981119 [Acanthaster planci]|uniref:U5 small nuclear ribonucleoprotein TSSC4 n=1 Tax=Acanthaster planci TaxID=133434 RepID=A0A8B7YN27_ACAPL|nr:uncharacterized protein LOC110981119 [Acanthaster planci]XP_022094066.1 uncharacterized protein LOC110981119 [Acanthaster planci]XP_022094067.1 uncharacterized protein LOC110981119 [Acanthaster planci]XP_022094068.1 uncharacterized protein LOC110981119 [Acanthaster planci]
MASESEVSAFEEEGLSSPSTFQLQTSSIRNSANFKSKSANIFGSLETIEKGYSSAVSERGWRAAGVETEEEHDAEEGLIKRGCIFKKPWDALSHKGSTVGSASQLSLRPSSGKPGFDNRAVSPSSRSLDTRPSVKVGSVAKPQAGAQQESSGSSSTTVFRKPDQHLDRRRSFGGRGEGRPIQGLAGRGRRGPPDHVLNPHKYTKYSLEETNMCGNSANRSVALGFLRELRKRKQQVDNPASEDPSASGQFVFKQPRQSTTEDQAEQPFKKTYGNVFKMPEYEVGKGPGLKSKKLKTARLREEHDSACEALVETEREKSFAVSVFCTDHFENEDSLNKGKTKDKGPVQLQGDNSLCHENTDKAEQSKPGVDEESFKSRKGKGKRHFRGRQEDA